MPSYRPSAERPRSHAFGHRTVSTEHRSTSCQTAKPRLCSGRTFVDVVESVQHLTSVLAEFVRYYNEDRPHRALRLQTPEPKLRPVTGPIRSRPVLNGL